MTRFGSVTWKAAASCRGRSRYLLRIVTVLTCGVFLFVFYIVNGVQQQVKLQQDVLQQDTAAAVVVESQEDAVAGVLARTARCAMPLYWAGQSNNYTVLYNYVPAEWGASGFNESVTYTTHATSRFLAHAEQVALRWSGPVSVAVYAPATDFAASLLAIQYLRQCRSPSVRRFVTFHLFFDAPYKPDVIPCSLDEAVPATAVDCDTYEYPNASFQADKRLTYPVNVARNIARISAQTQYVLPSDIELYPSVGLIPMFLDMIERQEQQRHLAATTTTSKPVRPPTASPTTKPPASVATSARSDRKKRSAAANLPEVALNVTSIRTTQPSKTPSKKVVIATTNNKNVTAGKGKIALATSAPHVATTSGPPAWAPTVYVLPLFEVDKSLPAPDNKTELLALLKKGKAVPFHKFVCPECHRVPKQEDWLKQLPSNGSFMSVLYSTKRHKPFQNWEPIYIGTNAEPLYDERLNWEGMSDKMTQAFEMCLKDYNFSILDNAFLVHAPGIKRYNKTMSQWRKDYVTQNYKLRRHIKKELISKYSPNSKCSL